MRSSLPVGKPPVASTRAWRRRSPRCVVARRSGEPASPEHRGAFSIVAARIDATDDHPRRFGATRVWLRRHANVSFDSKRCSVRGAPFTLSRRFHTPADPRRLDNARSRRLDRPHSSGIWSTGSQLETLSACAAAAVRAPVLGVMAPVRATAIFSPRTGFINMMMYVSIETAPRVGRLQADRYRSYLVHLVQHHGSTTGVLAVNPSSWAASMRRRHHAISCINFHWLALIPKIKPAPRLLSVTR